MAEQMVQEAAGKTIPAGYKQTEVGVIPEDWNVSTVGNEYEIKLGKMLDAGKNRGVPKLFLGNKAVQWGYIDITDLSTVPMSRSDIVVFRLCYGDLLVCEGGEVGRAAIWSAPISECYYQKALHRLRPLRGFNSVVMAALLRYWTDSGVLINYVTQTSIAHLPREKFMEVPMPIPPEKEQTAIANVLSDSDALIDALEQLIAKKQAIKSATMQQLLTGRTRLPAFALRPDGTPKGYKTSELGEIPEDWEVVSLGDASQFINGRAYALHEWESSGVPVIRLQNLTGRGDEYYYSNLQLPERQYCDFGDLLFMWSATFGPVIWKGSKAIYHYHIWKVECKSGNNKAFLFYLLGDMTERLKNSSSSGGTMLHVTKEKMESTKSIFPSIVEQTAIATILSDMDNELQALTQKLEKARALKQGMMQQLLTGKIRLPLAAGA